jgi:SMC interacting uncharacterized protein involved in chromosome segregation
MKFVIGVHGTECTFACAVSGSEIAMLSASSGLNVIARKFRKQTLQHATPTVFPVSRQRPH